MPTKKQNYDALKHAIEITKEATSGCGDKSKPEIILRKTYKAIMKLVDEIEQTEE